MTAREPNDTQSDNSGVTRDDLDAQTVLDYIRQQENVTVDGLAKRAGATKDELHWILDELQQRDLITVEQGMRAVHIQPTDNADDGVVTDGGLFDRLLRVGSPQPRPIDMSEQCLYRCLLEERRRKVIQFMAGVYDDDGGGYVEVATLAEALERNEADSELETDEIHRNYVSLVQGHLPVLDNNGLIEYHERPKKLRATEDAVVVADLMAQIDEMCVGQAWYKADGQDDQEEDGH